MELKATLALLTSIFVLSSTAVASDCDDARSKYSNHGLDIEKFRVGKKTTEEFTKEAMKGNGALLLNVDWQTYYRSYDAIRGYAAKMCGTNDGSPVVGQNSPSISSSLDDFSGIDRSIKSANSFFQKVIALKIESTPSFASSFVSLIKRERMDVTNDEVASQLLSDLKWASQIDISKPWTHEGTLKYPSLSGAMKEDAKEARKGYLQQWILKAYNDLQYAVFFNPQLQKRLEVEIPTHLSDEEATKACGQLRSQISKVDLEDLDPTYWRIHLDQGGTHKYRDCEAAVGLIEGESATDAQRDILKDQFKRLKLMEFLIATAMTIEPKRVSADQIDIKMTIDWPKFFKTYRFKKISDLVEK